MTSLPLSVSVCLSVSVYVFLCVCINQLMMSLLLSRSFDDVRDQMPRVEESVVPCAMSRRQNFVYFDYLANRFQLLTT